MYEIRQLEIPAAFLALYSRNGRAVESRGFIEARFDACEDLAQGVSDICTALVFKEGLTESAVLQRCHAGLLLTPQTVSAPEAGWVVRRTAELLDWKQPAFLPLDPASG